MLVDGQKLKPELPKGAIWFHASSVGEFEQARPIIEKLKAKNEKQKIVVTFFSPSGYEARKNYDKADVVTYLPFATRRKAKKFLNELEPKMAIFVKYEFWPAYLRELHKRDIPTYSICSIFRPKQIFFRFWGKWYLNVLENFTRLFVQNEESRDLLAKHGITNVSVIGDTRFDRVQDILAHIPNETLKRLAPVQEFTETCPNVIIAGSSWPQDEKLLAQYMQEKSWTTEKGQLKLILVPHEIDEQHLHFLFNLLQGRFVKYSALCRETSSIARRSLMQHADVMIIDTIGLLSSIYRFGHVAYIGGGFGVGIHNTIEAAVYGVPVIFGPNYDKFREAKGLIDCGAARTISNYKELENALDIALEQRKEIGTKAAEYVAAETGATEKICNEIFNFKF